MKANRHVSCIIPFFNEGPRLHNVLDKITKVSNINEIICIDDGSKINNCKKLRQQYPQIKIVRHAQNQGKSAALITGLKHSTHPHIFTCDADLQNLQTKEIEAGIQSYLNTPNLDMLLFGRVKDIWPVTTSRNHIILSGERILTKEDFEKIIKKPSKNFQIEAQINQYMINNQKITKWIAHSATSELKIKKFGLIKGTIRELKCFFDIASAAGMLKYLTQILFFAREEIKNPAFNSSKS